MDSADPVLAPQWMMRAAQSRPAAPLSASTSSTAVRSEASAATSTHAPAPGSSALPSTETARKKGGIKFSVGARSLAAPEQAAAAVQHSGRAGNHADTKVAPRENAKNPVLAKNHGVIAFAKNFPSLGATTSSAPSRASANSTQQNGAAQGTAAGEHPGGGRAWGASASARTIVSSNTGTSPSARDVLQRSSNQEHSKRVAKTLVPRVGRSVPHGRGALPRSSANDVRSATVPAAAAARSPGLPQLPASGTVSLSQRRLRSARGASTSVHAPESDNKSSVQSSSNCAGLSVSHAPGAGAATLAEAEVAVPESTDIAGEKQHARVETPQRGDLGTAKGQAEDCNMVRGKWEQSHASNSLLAEEEAFMRRLGWEPEAFENDDGSLIITPEEEEAFRQKYGSRSGRQ